MQNTSEQLHFGDIILIKYPSTDPSSSKKRPCMILREGEDDVLVCIISALLEKQQEEDVLLKQDKKNQLAADSLIKTHKITPVHRSLIYKKIGTLSPKDKEIAKKKLMGFIKTL